MNTIIKAFPSNKKNYVTIAKTGVAFAVVLLAVIAGSCRGESDEMAQKKLYAILDNDLKVLTEGIAKDRLLEKPYYKIISYEQFDKSDYSKKAVIDFFIFKQLAVKIERKYRYHQVKRMWERYFNDYKFTADTPAVSQTK